MKKRQWTAKVLVTVLAISTIVNSQTYAGTWQKDHKGWKYLAQNTYATDWLKEEGENWYHFGNDNYMTTGWYKDLNGLWYYLAADGVMLKNSWLKDPDNKWYYFAESGSMLSHNWLQHTDGKWYYFGDDGAMLSGSRTVTPDGYTLNEDGSWNSDVSRKATGPNGTVQSVKTFKGGGSSGGGGGGGGSGKKSNSGNTNNSGNSNNQNPVKGDDKEENNNPHASPSQATYSYSVQYRDAVTKVILYEIIGNAKKDSKINIDFLQFDNYEICDNQPETLTLSFNNKVANIYYEPISKASPSDAAKINWEIKFVDEETHHINLGEARKGSIEEGKSIFVNYLKRIVKDNEIWEAIEDPPLELSVYGPGDMIHYIEYQNIGPASETEDPDKKSKVLLEEYLQSAKNSEAEITGEEPDMIPDNRFYATSQQTNDLRIQSIATHIEDGKEHNFYIVGKNFKPNGVALAAYFGNNAVYSKNLEEAISIGSDIFYVTKFSLSRNFDSENCSHDWALIRQTFATCTSKGVEVYQCEKCGEEMETYTPALGHIDENNDSVCDVCNERVFEQKLGSEIQTKIAIEGNPQRDLTFVCIDDDYQGGMLYISKENIPLSDFGGYGNLNYEQSNVRNYFNSGFQNKFSIKGKPLMGIIPANISEADYAMILTKEEYEEYKDVIPETSNFLTRTEDSANLLGVNTDGSYAIVNPAEDSNYGIRPVILLRKPEAGNAESVYWNIGDMQAREIGGNVYMFECIDQNYADGSDNHKQTALFLCTSIIPANTGSKYEYQEQLDGTFNYVYKPGPISSFGKSNDYKYSNIRNWLSSFDSRLFGVEALNIATGYSYVGSTGKLQYSQFEEGSLNASYIGNQRLTGKLFVFSVEDAIRYKDYLWKFNGSSTENADTQYGAYSKAYWLRNPAGTSSDFEDTNQVYVVDLVNGNIHPQDIKISEDDNDESGKTSTVGIRPAIAIPQG